MQVTLKLEKKNQCNLSHSKLVSELLLPKENFRHSTSLVQRAEYSMLSGMDLKLYVFLMSALYGGEVGLMLTILPWGKCPQYLLDRRLE
jgi:hypothetical protein